MARKRRGRGEGSIYQRGDGLWVGSISLGTKPNGKSDRRVVYGHTKQEALEKKRELMTQLGRFPKDLRAIRKQSLQEFLVGWLAGRTCGDGCKDRYSEQIRLWINPIIGHGQIAKLTPASIAYLYEEMADRGASKNYIRRVGRMLRTALKGSGLVSNPALVVPLPKVSPPEVFPLNQDEITRLLKYAKRTRLYGLYLLALDSGMRQGEILALRWSDFDWQTGSVMVQRSLEERKGTSRLKHPKTKASRRRIQLASETLQVLKSIYEEAIFRHRTDRPVFYSRTGGYLRQKTFWKHHWRPLWKRAGIAHHRFHDLRHTCATQLLLAGENPKVVSQRLGHASIEITLSTYAHVLDGMQDSATQKMSNLLGKVLPREEEE